ncbi:unnamed protein product, partial [marine sediment metagenome]
MSNIQEFSKLIFPPLISAFLISALISSTNSYAASDDNTIIIQSTTSTQNSGLLDYLLPKFSKKTGIKVHVVAVGTGQALKNAELGNGDILLVHAKSAEEKFIEKGFGVKRYDVMYNDFVIVGPKNDPAKIAGSKR